MLEAALLVGSTADWRTGCATDRLATVSQPVDDSVANPRMYQMVWDPALRRHAWVDITRSVSGGSVTGVIDRRFLGVIAIMSIPGQLPIPALSASALFWLAVMLLVVGSGFTARRAVARG
jgi:hypothetical protein